MKKILCSLIAFCILLVCSMPVYAEIVDPSSLFDDADDIKEHAEEIFQEGAIVAIPEFTSKDVDYERVLKIYYNVDLFDLDNIDENSANDLLEKAEYYFTLQVDTEDGKHLDLGFQKGAELTDEIRERLADCTELIESIEAEEGKWLLTSEREVEKSNYDQFKKDIIKFAENSKTKYKKIHVINELSGNLLSVAMLVTENSEIQFKIINGSANGKKIDYDHPDDNLYTLKELDEIASQFDPSDFSSMLNGLEPTTQPSNNNAIIIASACAGTVIIIAAAAVTVICIKKKKAKASAELSE